ADGLRDARALELAAQAESLAARGLARALAARELGQAGDLTVLQAQVGLDAARRARRAAQADRAASATALAVLLGERPDAPVICVGDLDSLAPLPRPPARRRATPRPPGSRPRPIAAPRPPPWPARGAGPRSLWVPQRASKGRP